MLRSFLYVGASSKTTGSCGVTGYASQLQNLETTQRDEAVVCVAMLMMSSPWKRPVCPR